MCGIAGIYAFAPEGKDSFAKMEQAVSTMLQRGPDCQKIYSEKKICFGHARLSVIDLSESASQPLHDVTGRYTIIFNGEIFNFQELRANLAKKGLPIKTQSDTETLLYQYIIDGPKCLDKLVGFFAFAIYDSREDTLFIARDRMGQKPLLYYRNRDRLVFASEMKTMMALGIPKVIDKVSLTHYFQFNYIPSPYTIFEDVHKLSPGHYLMIEKGQMREHEYYSIPYNRSHLGAISYDNAKIKLQSLIEESVKSRLISDVPLGAFLSGGIDSSVIVAEASKHTSQLNTFSIGYTDEPFFDETEYANLVARKFNTNHQVFKLTNNDLYENLNNTLDYIDEPFADSSALAVNILSKYTRKYVTVALSGDGADEMFGGYNKHLAHLQAIEGGLKNALIRAGSPLFKLLPQSRNSKNSNRARQAYRMAKGLKLNAKERYWLWASLMGEEQVAQLLNNQVALNDLAQRKTSLLKYISPIELINDVLYSDMHLVLVSDMLHKVDSMSMANSLEVRSPFLDHRLVNFVFSLPGDYLVNGNMRKRILQDTYRDVLPAELYQRPKHGFEVPLLNWFKGELKPAIDNIYLNEEWIIEQKIFNPLTVRKIKEKLNSNSPGDAQAHLWALIVFQHWWKKYMF